MIKVKNLNKVYKQYSSSFKQLKSLFTSIEADKTFHVLKNISFEVEKGETFGIIGDNGAGKSTLLSILAGTLKPSSGSIEIKGKKAAVLELGSFFIEDFTGLENIRMYKSLLGIDDSSFEKRVYEFSELNDYFYMPIRAYSSGMTARLAFSAAMSSNPEVFFVDEVLSVGDQRFQKKSLEKIVELKNSGCTLVFCSHNLYQVELLCSRALWLHKGEIVAIGNSRDVVKQYEIFSKEKREKVENSPQSDNILNIEKIESSYNGKKHTCHVIVSSKENTEVSFGFGLFRNDDFFIFGDIKRQQTLKKNQKKEIDIEFDLTLGRGSYYHSFAVLDKEAINVLAIKSSSKFQTEGHNLGISLIDIPSCWKISR